MTRSEVYNEGANGTLVAIDHTDDGSGEDSDGVKYQIELAPTSQIMARRSEFVGPGTLLLEEVLENMDVGQSTLIANYAAFSSEEMRVLAASPSLNTAFQQALASHFKAHAQR